MISSENKLHRVVENLRDKNLPGLSFFLTGGYPNMSRFIKILKFIDENKLADFIEIGIPFSDPVADGVIIQDSSRTAIKKGATFRKIICRIKEIKSQLEIPLVLMSYLNLILAGGLQKNLKLIKQAGFSAIIIPDLPVDESEEILKVSKSFSLDVVFLASPSTELKRVSHISHRSFPFLYYVSRFGITGVRKELSADISNKIKLIKKHSKVPVYCGFGISNPEQAAMVGKYSDGVIIGSALTRLISESGCFKEIKKFAISIKKELKVCKKK